ncbi:MAG TPA: aspartate kinase [Edaphocola sp.]|nr:aspartate kinase [Edaphocola sp.]
MTQVYKFGGASIASPGRMRALLPIIRSAQDPLVIVVSAYGKTTNALEEIVWTVIKNDRQAAMAYAQKIEQAHWDYAREVLSPEAFALCEPALNGFFTELHWAMDDIEGRSLDFVYDQVVGIGELLSTTIFAAFLNDSGLPVVWQDARDIIRTDDCYRDARVDELITGQQIKEKIAPLIKAGKIVVTQGFIGSTDYNATTTLGREGSDYSGALLAAMLPAGSLSIWKDVEGLMNADPRQFKNVQKIPEITFHEVIEMAFYGAQVIHPKTIKPLHNAGIPLKVKCFLKPEVPGTLIHQAEAEIPYPPLIVLKEEQTLLQITSRDFSFINEGNLSRLYQVFNSHQLKINMIQNAAISVVVVVNNIPNRISPLIETLEKDYKVLRNDHQQLLTVRHYNDGLLNQLTKDKKIILTQKTRQTIQMVLE